MIKKRVGAIVCILALLSQVACGQVENEEKVIAKVNDSPIYRWELDNYYKQQVDTYNDANGVNLDDSQYTQERLQYREDLLQDLIDQKAIVAYGENNGYALTSEEKQEVSKELADAKERKIEEFKETDFASDSDAEAKAEAKWEEWLKENHYTEETLEQDMEDSKVHEKVVMKIYDEQDVSEERIQEVYEEMVKEQKETFTDDPKAYLEKAQVPSGYVVYNPAGFVRIKYILIGIPEKYDTEIKKLDNELQEVIVKRGQILEAKGDDATNDKSYQETVTKEAELKEKTEALYEEAYAEKRDTAEEALKAIEAGDDFDELIKKYGEDPVMTTEPFSEIGFLVSGDTEDVTYDVAQAAMNLKEVGDTSQIIRSEVGYTILELVSKVQEGPIPLNDEIRKAIMDTQKMQPLYTELDTLKQQARAEVTVEVSDDPV